jgi:GLPGLI family protein
MKDILLITLCCTIYLQQKAQTMEAHYAVTNTVEATISENKTKEIKLDLEGLIYQSGAKTICYMTPQYLSQYPSGSINLKTDENSFAYYMLNTESIQIPHLVNMDSLKEWKCFNLSGGYKQFFTGKFEKDNTKWNILPETKIINGLQCKHAQLLNSTNTELIHDIWFYPDVTLEFGLWGINNAPGLIVECNSPSYKTTYSLKYFKKGEAIPDEVFLPDIFKNAVFEDLTPTVKTPKQLKKLEIDKEKEAIMIEQ